MPCGQKGRVDQFCTSRTGPMAPFQIHSQSKRVASEAWWPTAICVDTSNKLTKSSKARVSYKVQRNINARLNTTTSTKPVSSNPHLDPIQKIEIIFHSNK